MDKIDKKKKYMPIAAPGFNICHLPGCNEQLPKGRRKYCSDRHLNFAYGKNYLEVANG